MAKVKVRVLYPTAFVALGVDPGAEEVSIDEEQAATLIGNGWAELVEGKTGRRVATETADVTLTAKAEK